MVHESGPGQGPAIQACDFCRLALRLLALGPNQRG
jgi:hypothetical protein